MNQQTTTVDRILMLGTKRRFNPGHYGAPVDLPDYAAHRGQIVVIQRLLVDGVEYDREGGEHMYRVAAEDGWTGEAWEHELEPI